VEAPQSIAELDAIAIGVPGPKVANMVERGHTPLLGPRDLHDRGFDLIVFPVAAILAQARAVEDVFAALRRDGSPIPLLEPIYPFEAFNGRVGLDAHRAGGRAALGSPPRGRGGRRG